MTLLTKLAAWWRGCPKPPEAYCDPVSEREQHALFLEQWRARNEKWGREALRQERRGRIKAVFDNIAPGLLAEKLRHELAEHNPSGRNLLTDPSRTEEAIAQIVRIARQVEHYERDIEPFE